ncbi:MAG: hypothetical protein KAU50_09115, partial [Candidatus Marinimicrobia bacterium]|nr:hypothetical protein [Candidatus Neomarinimicrobiota bacterium]
MPASFKSMRIVIACLIVFMMADTIPAQDRGFSNEYSYRHYTRNRTYDVKHLKLNISIDYESASISGTAATVFSPINDGLEQLVLDAVEMEIAGVTLLTQLEAEARPKQATRDLAFTVENDKLIIDLDHPYNRDDQVIVEVAYQTQPKMGLYFVKPDEGYPDKPLQVWSQGEQEESRYWFPCYDFPN